MTDEPKYITVADVLRDAFDQYSADGLCNEDCGCGKSDIGPCGEVHGDCVFAKRVPCPDPECADCDGYHYVPLAPWLPAPDGPGWWWIEGRSSPYKVESDNRGNLLVRTGCQSWLEPHVFCGSRFQRVQPPRGE